MTTNEPGASRTGGSGVRGAFFGAPLKQDYNMGDLFWGPRISGNYHTNSKSECSISRMGYVPKVGLPPLHDLVQGWALRVLTSD